MADGRLVLEAGVYDIPASVYHADPCPAPSLSSSIAQRICQSSAAHARQAHPRLNLDAADENCDAYDMGTAAHAMLLEGTAAVAVIDAKDWRTNAAKDARDKARADGLTPLLAARWLDLQAMMVAARLQLAQHRDGGSAMFLNGEPERTLIWQEPSGVWCRARLDWLRQTPLSVDDYKTTSASANPDSWSRSMFSSGWDLQAAWYLRGVQVLTGHVATFRFCVQETFPPYALSVISLGPDALLLAEKKCIYALDIWQRCLQSGDWTGYPRQTCYATLPPWHEAEWLEKEMR
jgi:hypothetical protein